MLTPNVGIPMGRLCYLDVASKHVKHNANVERAHSDGVTFVILMTP